ncbi:ABC transporter substrate-binding protein [Halorussus salilacus]|uniref:ABC transporter substrate-binding protein n=1 Tax=Halorussus salilacus TaxID=2953750 RepID=UPI00209E381F|nr:ABC transporter substrate-binding protein [Halorussus salilacus]USZ69388.1 ABC transporter substrate-binding protein [Halorussus salilacus]
MTAEVRLGRRALLAGAATASTAGCLDRVERAFDPEDPEQVSLRIASASRDADEYGMQIARHLAERCREAGITTSVHPVEREELERRVLLNHEYDVYVAQFPKTGSVDPDDLYPILHSAFEPGLGWQNPFGYVDDDVDDRLATQRRTEGSNRREAVVDLQQTLARTQPFVPVAFPDVIRALRPGRFEEWSTDGLDSALAYLSLSPAEGDEPHEEFRGVLTDGRATENLNPLSVEFRRHGAVIDLLYGSLARRIDGEVRPWLAEEWSFDGGDEPTATVALRADLAWHDGEDLTAEDVAFTYRFLADTSLGDADDPVPSGRYRGRSSLVADIEAADERTVRIEFEESSETVARRAFTVPVLPEHVWADRSDRTSIEGMDVEGEVTEALVWTNPDPVGSGPFEFVRSTPREMLLLERHPDHFLWEAEEGVAERFGDPAFDRLSLRVASSDVTAIERVAAGQADATVTGVGTETVSRIEDADGLELAVDRSRAFYHVGFNCRREPMVDADFRRALAGLLDKAFVADDLLDGYATPIASPLAGTEWLPEGLEFDGRDPTVPFYGTDGELDAERAREAFRDAGFEYTDDGRLVRE